MRVRPKLMTVLTIVAGLLPIFFTDGLGSDVMRRIALPMVGGMVSTTLLTLIVIPVFYYSGKVAASRRNAHPPIPDQLNRIWPLNRPNRGVPQGCPDIRSARTDHGLRENKWR